MLLVGTACALLVVLTTVLHYEVLRGLNAGLPGLRVAARGKLLLVILAAFSAHAVEIVLYAFALWMLALYGGVGHLGEAGRFTFNTALYFSAETYTTLGYGDVVPAGDLRLLAGVEALNGLLLIGWSASYVYIAMERFWREGSR